MTGLRRAGNFVAGAIALVALLAACGDSTTEDTNSEAASALRRTDAPWAPDNDGLRDRVDAAGFPPVGDESYHVHALLSVFVEGEPVEVPANIGIDVEAQFMSPLHTHTPDGVLHFEADEPAPFTLEQVFTMWGVEFSADRLGAYTTDGRKRIHVYVNGAEVEDPAQHEISERDNIVVAYGAPGSFPTEPADDALQNA